MRMIRRMNRIVGMTAFSDMQRITGTPKPDGHWGIIVGHSSGDQNATQDALW
jgi:hypothetical protein